MGTVYLVLTNGDSLLFIDKMGSKYLEFYKFKENEDRKTFISNLENCNYNPIFTFQEEEKLQKSYLSKTSNQEDFEIMFNFEVLEEEWIDNADKTIKTKQIIHKRRVLYVHNIGDYVILNIDPIGIGRTVCGSR